MTERYQVVSKNDSPATLDSATIGEALAKDGQFLLPMLDLIETAQFAIDDLIDVMGRATIEAVLKMSAAGVVGPKQQGKKIRSRHRLSRLSKRASASQGARTPRR